MLKLYFGAHRPAVTEVIAHIDGDVWQVEASVGRVILVFLRKLVAVEMVAVEVAAGDSLAISSKGKPFLGG